MGWSATAGAADNFVYEDANDIFIADPEMQKRLMETNPNAFRDMVTTFLEANGRGYWDTTEENLDRLRELYAEVDDKIGACGRRRRRAGPRPEARRRGGAAALSVEHQRASPPQQHTTPIGRALMGA